MKSLSSQRSEKSIESMKKLIVFDLDGTLSESKAALDAEMSGLLHWGKIIEDRGTQIPFSALGQQAPIEEKKKWDTDSAKRKQMKALLADLIPEFSVRLGGTTSIDISKLGIDKGYGIRKLHDTLGIAIDEMIFISDALFPGGNDYPAKEAGVVSIQVRDSNEDKRVIETIVACHNGEPNPEDTETRKR